MFQSTFSPVCDTRGDDTINIVSTPYFTLSPPPFSAAATVSAEGPEGSSDSKVSRRLFFNSSVSFLSEWTTDSSSNDWTTDSEAEPEEPENEFRWSATP